MDINQLIKATRQKTNLFLVNDRLELLKIIDSKDGVQAIKEKLNNDIDNILTSYKYLVDNEPENKELKREFQQLQQMIKKIITPLKEVL